MDVCDALTDHSSEFIEQLHDKIIDLEDNLLDQQIPRRAIPGSAAQTINRDALLYGTATRTMFMLVLPVNVCRG